MKISVIIASAQGCAYASSVADAVRLQLDADDEIIVAEPDQSVACDAQVPPPHVTHLHTGTADEFVMRARALALADGDIVLVLENHGVPGPGFIQALRHTARARASEAATFYYANGTPGDVTSEAAFLFVGGFATLREWPRPPAIIGSAFALWGEALDRARSAARIDALDPGELEYSVVPSALATAEGTTPKELAVVHYQRNTARQALAANYWNARRTGEIERHTIARRGRVIHMARRYLERPLRLAHRNHPSPAVTVFLLAIGAASFIGWWTGRWFGSGNFAKHMVNAHDIAVP